MNFPVILVEQSHHQGLKTYIAYAPSDLTNQLWESVDNWSRHEFQTMEDWLDVYGSDPEEWPVDEATVLQCGFPLVQECCDDQIELVPLVDAISELEFAIDYIRRDLQHLFILESIEECQCFMKSYFRNTIKLRECIQQLSDEQEWDISGVTL